MVLLTTPFSAIWVPAYTTFLWCFWVLLGFLQVQVMFNSVSLNYRVLFYWYLQLVNNWILADILNASVRDIFANLLTCHKNWWVGSQDLHNDKFIPIHLIPLVIYLCTYSIPEGSTGEIYQDHPHCFLFQNGNSSERSLETTFHISLTIM